MGSDPSGNYILSQVEELKRQLEAAEKEAELAKALVAAEEKANKEKVLFGINTCLVYFSKRPSM